MMRNSLCFVYRLPTETLESIFIHCAGDYYYHSLSTHFDHTLSVPTWVNVSYVSRRWRHVALNCPTLWTYLFIVSSRWTEELLIRSKQASLKLHACLYSNTAGLRSVEQIMDHVERIQELRLHCNNDALSKVTACALSLQHLEVFLSDDQPNWSWLPFGGDTPVLRTLKLSYCPTPWYSFKLSGLTTLDLSKIPVQFQQRTEDFLATLNCMQDLTHLHLDATLASAASFLSGAAFHTFQKINLPHLSRLEIMAQPSTVVALLSCVNIPLKAELKLNSAVEDRSTTTDHYTMLCSLLAQRLSMSEDEALYGQTIRTLLISFTQLGDADIAFGTLEHDLELDSVCLRIVGWDPYFPLQIIQPACSITHDNRERIISHMCCPIPLLNIQSLYVSGPPYSQRSWTHVLGHLPGLRYLKLGYGRMPDIAPLLSLARHDHTENQGRQSDLSGTRVFVPQVEVLELKKIRFLTGLQTDMPDSLKISDTQSLHDALSTRKDPRVRFTVVCCTECDFKE